MELEAEMIDLQLALELANLSRMAYGAIEPSIGQQITVGDDSCFISPFREGHAIAFRGTVPPSMTDPAEARTSALQWMSNADCRLIRSDSFVGKIHEGFLKSYLALMPLIQPHVTGAIYITGHSRGGALATLAGTSIASVATMTFGSPRVGDAEFSREYDLWNSHHCRFENLNDVVPHTPPTAALAVALADVLPVRFKPEYFQAVGQLCYLAPDGSLRTDDTDELWFERETRLIAAGSSLIGDHFLDSYIASIQALMR